MSYPALTMTQTEAKPASMEALRQLVAPDMARVNQLITQNVKSDITLISDLATHIVAAGGKRIRPSLTLTSAALCGYTGERHIRLAACVEFIHTATLLHDDVVDASALRRGEATANALWGNKSSVLVGDFLLSRAFQLMVADGAIDVLTILSNAAATISAGEVKQLMVSHDLGIAEAVYLEVIGAKTAALFAAATELGAVVADQPEQREALRRFGYALGMAFQLIDDALDYQAREEDLGKAIGDDFRDGKVTLPVMIAYREGNAEARAFWEKCLADASALSAADLARAQQLIHASSGLDYTHKLAARYGQEAATILNEFPPTAARDAMAETVEFCIERRY
jgi:octaprenyl-diphosphate synthase